MRIEVNDLTKRFGDLTAVDDVSIEVEDGEFVTFVGPSGCGKTTTLRCIVGLEYPTSGEILFDGEDVTDQSAQERDVAMVFQNLALYPHMTARRNISFSLEDAGLPKDEIERKVADVSEMLGISDHLDKKPGQLSGGQQQRVALGRSIVRDPDVFLLDEPLSNLDAKLRIQMRAELQKIHRKLDTTMIYVTHDQEEALTMSDRVAVLNDGKLQQFSPPEIAYNQPANRFMANFIGSPSMNFISCDVRDGTITTSSFSFDLPGLDRDSPTGNPITTLGIRPEDIELSDDGLVSGVVSVFEQVGSFNLVYLDVEGVDQEIIAQVPSNQYFAANEEVELSVIDDRVHLFDETGTAAYHPPLHDETNRDQTVSL